MNNMNHKPYKTRPVESRFWAKVDRNGPLVKHMRSQCYLWTGAKSSNGYGVFSISEDGKWKRVSAHRFVYEMQVGSIPKGLDVLHSCDTKLCVNYRHLHAGTPKVNIFESIQRGRNHHLNKTHCPQGHPYDTANTYVIQGWKGRTARSCKICNDKRSKDRYLNTKKKLNVA